MNLLLTGSTGFLGRNFLLEAIASKKYAKIWLPVRSVDKFQEQIRAEKVDTSSLQPFESTLDNWRLGEAASAEHVVHSAGAIFARTKKEYWDTNVEGTLSLFRALKNPQRVVVLSSLAAGGPSGAGETRTEDQVEAPVTWYGGSKLEMEKRLSQEFSTVPYVCLRPPMIFGPRDHATLPLFKMMRKKVHFKAGFRTKYYSVLAVSDLSRAIFAALEKPLSKSRIYFVAHDKVITDRELLEGAARVCGQPSRVVAVPQFILKGVSRVVDGIPTWRTTIPSLSVDRAKEIWPDRWVISAAAFERDFGWAAKTPFQKALQETYDWYRASGQL